MPSVNNLRLGSSVIDRIFFGDTEVSAAYLGDTLLYHIQDESSSSSSIVSPIPDDPVLYFNMDDTGNTAVDSVMGFTLNKAGSMVNSVSGIRGTSWKAQSQGSYLYGSNQDFVLPSTFTLNFWVFLTNYPPEPVYPAQVNATCAEFGSHSSYSGYGIYMNYQGKISGRVGQDYNHYGSYVVPLNSWTMITMTCDGSYIKTYVNGTLDTSRSFYSSVYSSTEMELFSRAEEGYGGEYVLGKIDELYLYDYAWTPELISDVYYWYISDAHDPESGNMPLGVIFYDPLDSSRATTPTGHTTTASDVTFSSSSLGRNALTLTSSGQYIRYSPVTSIPGSCALSIWAKPVDGMGLYGNIFAYGNSGGNTTQISICRDSTAQHDQIQINTWQGPQGPFGTFNDLKNVWHHYLAVYDHDNSMCYLYLDGVQVTSFSMTSNFNSSYLAVGQWDGFWRSERQAIGQMAAARIYGRTLTPSEIYTLAHEFDKDESSSSASDSSSSTLPYKRELAYLEGTGTQYIDTGVSPTTDTGCSLDFMATSEEGTHDFCFCGIGSDNWRWGGVSVCLECPDVWYQDSIQISGIMATGTTWINYAYPSETRYVVDFNKYSDGCAYVNGTLVRSSITTGNVVTSGTIYLFAYNYSTSGSSYGTPWRNASGKVYSLKLYSGETTVRDFIPVMDNNDVPCMYDKVSGQLFYNQGTGTFLYGELPDDSSSYL